ncbi:MAG: methionine--tRNA ligase [Acidobacteria bacterium]|nr:methionine--tRNA ligase [Acidobacteriota bacterium]
MSFYITCAIDYPNRQPHIGTAYEKIAADTIARYKRLAGEDVFFLMGLDEHSQNVYKRAQEEGLEPIAFTDRMEGVFRAAWAAVNVEFDDFIRTTEDRHRIAVEAMVQRAEAAGDFYEGVYKGFYCVSCEAYYSDRDLVDGKCPVHETEPEFREETNVFFRLSAYQARLEAHYEEHPEFVQPDYRRNELLSLLDEGLEDISVSRASDGWGIPMPGHEGQAVYVWFDALTNYLAATGFPEETDTYKKFWPADMHLVGKDITRFHAIIWPAMLMSAGVPLPKVVYGHGWVLTGGGRMSKSVGNVMDPVATAERFGADALRYFLLRETPFGRDLEFDHERFVARYNADLANDLGNLLQRTVGMAMKYQNGALGGPAEGDVTRLAAASREVEAEYREAMEGYELQGGLKAIWKLVAAGNLAVDTHAPWVLAKDPAKAAELDAVLSQLAALLRQVAVLVHPFMPERSATMAQALGQDADPAAWRLDDLHDPSLAPRQVHKSEPLFPRLDVEEVIEGRDATC